MTHKQKHSRASSNGVNGVSRKPRPLMAAAHAHPRTDDANAFIPDPGDGPVHTSDDLAERLGEDYVAMATRGSEPLDEELDGVVPEEMGGPFVETSAAEEFANDVDETNPIDAEQEPLPRPVAGLIAMPHEESMDLDDEDEDYGGGGLGGGQGQSGKL